MSLDEEKQRRRKNFYRWWNKNKTNVKAHEWLVRTARTYAYTYNYHPNVFTLITTIAKRWFNSEYKRLTMDDAWCLWKHSHLLQTERVQLLIKSGDYYKENREKRKEALKEQKTFTVESKKKKVFKK